MPAAQTSPGLPLTGLLARCALMPGVTSRPPTLRGGPHPDSPPTGGGSLTTDLAVDEWRLRRNLRLSPAARLEQLRRWLVWVHLHGGVRRSVP
jgi:hypothetical protein